MRTALPYPQSALLPGVRYPSAEDTIFGDPLLDLEYRTLRNLENLADAIKTALIEEGLIQVPELLVAHLCAYLGYLSVYTIGLEACYRSRKTADCPYPVASRRGVCTI